MHPFAMIARMPAVRMRLAGMLSQAHASKIRPALQLNRLHTPNNFIDNRRSWIRSLAMKCSQGAAAANAPVSEAPPITVQVSIEATASSVPYVHNMLCRYLCAIE